MFIGEYHISIDDKGRIVVPTKLRETLALGGVVTRGLDSSLFLMLKGDWEKLAQKLGDLPLNQANSRSFARFMLAGATEIAPDKQGRFLIPEYLRVYAGINKEVVLVGVHSRLELWAKDKWLAYAAEVENRAEELAESLTGLGL